MKNRHLYSVSLEDRLEIEKVYDKEQSDLKSDGFDTLYQNLKDSNDINTPEEPTDADNVPSDQSTDNTDDTPNTDTTVTAESLYKLYPTVNISMESPDAMTMLRDAGHVAGVGAGMAYNGAKYLGGKIVDVTPSVLSGIKKGLMHTGAAIVASIGVVKKFSKDRTENYKSYSSKVTKLKAALMELEKKLASKPYVGDKPIYDNTNYIQVLQINGNTEFDKHGVVLLKMFTDFSNVVLPYIKDQTNYTVRLTQKALHKEVVMADSIVPLPVKWSGFNKHIVAEFKPKDSNLDMYTYQYSLPGDHLLMGYNPISNLEDPDSIDHALKSSKVFLGIDEHKVKSTEQCPYLDIKRLHGYLNTLAEICQVGLKHQHDADEIVKLKETLNKSTQSYFAFINDDANTKAIRADLAKHISSRVEYIDKTLVYGSMAIQSYVVQYLKASTEYCKSLIKAYS